MARGKGKVSGEPHSIGHGGLDCHVVADGGNYHLYMYYVLSHHMLIAIHESTGSRLRQCRTCIVRTMYHLLIINNSSHFEKTTRYKDATIEKNDVGGKAGKGDRIRKASRLLFPQEKFRQT